MKLAKDHNIVLHYKGEISILKAVVAKNYTIKDFIVDITDLAFTQRPELRTGCIMLTYECWFEGQKTIQSIFDDHDLQKMFERSPKEINVHVGCWEASSVQSQADRMNEANRIDEFGAGIDGFGVGNAESGGYDYPCDDDEYDTQETQQKSRNEIVAVDSDSSFGADPGNESEMNLPSNSSDTNMSGYESDNYCEWVNDSDEDIPNDPLRGWSAVDETRVPLNHSEKFKLQKGHIFATVEEFRKVLKDYCIREGCKIVKVKNDKVKVTCHCAAKEQGCQWRVHASILPDGTTFSIKSYVPDHTCVRVDKVKEANAIWLSEKLVPILRKHPDMKVKGLLKELKKIGVQPGYMQLYRAKKRAVELIDGNHSESYLKLPQYAEMVNRTNPGSLLKFEYVLENDHIPAEPCFKRFFLGLNCLKNGFLEGCQPFLGFDGCHLKGVHGGILLSAIAIDGNLGLYPLAFAVVETENKESWGFFFHCLDQMLGGFGGGKPWTFMTDRQKGLVEAIKDAAPDVTNRRCCRHIYANLRQVHSGILVKKLFWAAARSYTAQGFNQAMNKLKEVKPGAFQWLINLGDCSTWSRHAFGVELKNDHVTNNISESFNHWIGDLRQKPILKLLDGIRSKVMHRVETRYQNGLKWTTKCCSRVVTILNKAKNEASKCSILVGGQHEFQIYDESVHYIVNLQSASCDCRVWDISGIPCRHAACAIAYKRQDIESYVHNSFSKDMYLNCYTNKVLGIPDPLFWPPMAELEPSTLKPPILKRLPGRPKKHRRREPGEEPKSIPSRRNPKVKCGICGSTGHNKRTCQRNQTSYSSIGQKRGSQGSNVDDNTLLERGKKLTQKLAKGKTQAASQSTQTSQLTSSQKTTTSLAS